MYVQGASSEGSKEHDYTYGGIITNLHYILHLDALAKMNMSEELQDLTI
jgi:hypothetical protein